MSTNGRCNVLSYSIILKISTRIREILTYHLESFNFFWKSRPAMIKILTYYHENINSLSSKSRPFILGKLSTFYHNGAPLVLPVSRFLDLQHFKKIAVKKFWKMMEQSKSWRWKDLLKLNAIVTLNLNAILPCWHVTRSCPFPVPLWLLKTARKGSQKMITVENTCTIKKHYGGTIHPTIRSVFSFL